MGTDFTVINFCLPRDTDKTKYFFFSTRVRDREKNLLNCFMQIGLHG